MKLSAKYNRINITVTIAIFLLGSICFFFVLRYILINELDDALRSEQQEIMQYVDAHNALPEIQNTKEQTITFGLTDQLPEKPFMKSGEVYNRFEKENEISRQYIFPLQVNDKKYMVTVTRSQEETEDLIQIIILVTVIMIALMLLVNFIFNRKVLSRLWNPFYSTINNIKDYRLSGKQNLQLDGEGTDEFQLLNESLNQMSLRISKDYDSLKRFTANAAHEMQTPVAVIRSKIEVMMQASELKQDSMQHLQEIEGAALKLGKLHQSLLLLAKLENNQFILNEQVNLRKIIADKLEERRELFEARNIRISESLNEVNIFSHQHLAEILVTNLMNNALRYTPTGGEVNILLGNEQLSVSNTAINGKLDNNNIFKRFYKSENTTTEGTGLGLAIVKEICTTAGFTADYFFENTLHKFVISFK